jgi:hypothetical protein
LIFPHFFLIFVSGSSMRFESSKTHRSEVNIDRVMTQNRTALFKPRPLYRLPTDSTVCQPLLHQSANRAAGRICMDACRLHGWQQLADDGIGWQPVESIGNQWSQLASGGIHAKAWNTM